MRVTAAAIFFLSIAHAQTTGGIEGLVTDPSDAAIRGASIRLLETTTGAERRIASGGAGYYFAQGLAPGVYDIQAEYAGFRTVTRRGVILDAGRSLRIDFQLQLGETSQGVAVDATASLVSPSAADWGSSVGQMRLENLPLHGRDLFDLSALETGATLSYASTRSLNYGSALHMSVNGARPTENSYRVDGIYVNDTTGSAPSSATGQTLGVEAVAELRLVASPFLAEYGRAAGAMFTAVSKSGTNEMHGSIFDFFRNSAMDAKNYVDSPSSPIPPLKRNQFGGLLGGPIVRQRWFFLGDYEGVRSTSGQTSIATTLGAAARSGQLPGGNVAVSSAVTPFLQLYPLPNGALFSDGTGQYIAQLNTPSQEDYAVGKVDYLRSERLRFATRYAFDRAGTSTPDPYLLWLFNSKSQYHFAQTEAQFVESPATLHNLHAGFSRIDNLNSANQTGQVPAGVAFLPGEPMGAIQVTGLTDLGGITQRQRPTHYVTNDYQLNYDVSHVSGAHSLKAGAGFDRVQLNQDSDMDLFGDYQFTSLATFLKGVPSSGALQIPGSTTVRGWRQNLFFAFVQDEFHVTRRLEITAGLRYEPYSTPTEVNGKVASLPDPLRDPAVTVGGPLFRNPSKTNFGPRLALAWDVLGDGRTVFRAGAGIFYDLLSTDDLTYSGDRMPPFYARVQPSKPPFPNLASIAGADGGPLQIEGMQYYESQPYVTQIQAAIEHQWGATMVRVGYAESHGVHLPGYAGDVNIPVPSILPGGQLYFSPTAPLLNPNFGRIGMRLTQFPSWSNQLQLHAERRLTGGFRMQAKYAWGKVLDESSNSILNDYLNGDYVPNPLNFRSNRGPSNFDIRQVFAADWSWQPRGFLRGWELHGILQAQTGTPFNPIIGFDRAGLRDNTAIFLGQRPDFVPIPGAPLILGDPAQWFNPNLFAIPASGTYGNLGRNTLTGPGLVDLDLAVHRTLWAREQRQVNLRVEMFNVANHPNFQIPSGLKLFGSTGQPVASAGQITQTTTTSRQIQLAIRASF
ncbi:MAG: TonB-dependent receptor [Acidobacteriia bacterium]|nr:TonB-dependent receptor [Terriglobia bacterium]